MIMGAPGQPGLSVELTKSFCHTDPEIAKPFAKPFQLTAQGQAHHGVARLRFSRSMCALA